MDQLETAATRMARSVGELEVLGEELSETVGRQGIELARLEDMSCPCLHSSSDSYRTPEVAGEGSRLMGRVSPALSLQAVGTPLGSRTLPVSSAEVSEPPAENAIALHVPVRWRTCPCSSLVNCLLAPLVPESSWYWVYRPESWRERGSGHLRTGVHASRGRRRGRPMVSGPPTRSPFSFHSPDSFE